MNNKINKCRKCHRKQIFYDGQIVKGLIILKAYGYNRNSAIIHCFRCKRISSMRRDPIMRRIRKNIFKQKHCLFCREEYREEVRKNGYLKGRYKQNQDGAKSRGYIFTLTYDFFLKI